MSAFIPSAIEYKFIDLVVANISWLEGRLPEDLPTPIYCAICNERMSHSHRLRLSNTGYLCIVCGSTEGSLMILPDSYPGNQRFIATGDLAKIINEGFKL